MGILKIINKRMVSMESVSTTAVVSAMERYKQWCNANNKEGYLKQLNPPVSLTEISETETKIKMKIPAELRAFLLIHNGGVFFGDRLTLLSAKQIADAWEFLEDDTDADDNNAIPSKGVKKLWWNKKWIPVEEDPSSNHVVVDMDPADGGHVGQMVQYDHAAGDRYVVAPDFETWLSGYLEALFAKHAAGKLSLP